jgi:RNA polymerase sigma-70 factor, ECF subfamily
MGATGLSSAPTAKGYTPRVASAPPPTQRDQVWSQLMSAAQRGDQRAYSRLLREVTPFIRALLRRRCSQADDVEEMVQETLLTLHRVRQTYDPKRPFSPWLGAIVARRGVDGLRRRSRVARHEVSTESDSYETFADPEANIDIESVCAPAQLEELLRRLPPRQREALEVVKIRELSLAEASLVSGQSVAALKVNTHRALKALRALFGNANEQ